MKKLKICILIDTLAMGGAEQVAVLTACELSRQGHDIVLLAYHAQNDFADTLKLSGVKTILIKRSKIWRMRRLRRVFSECAFDVVHAYKATCLIWGVCASIGLKQGIWFAGHHALTSESLTVRALCRLLRSRFSGWIVPSEAAAVVTRHDYAVPDKAIHVVSNPVNLAAFQRQRDAAEAKRALGLSSDILVVTIVANLHPWKDYPFFLRMARRVALVRDDVIFLSVGRDLQHGEVHALCLAFGLESRVRFLGHRLEVASVLEATDIAVITSPMEAFCLALAEAGAMGLPCVSTDNGGAAEVLVSGETGFIVPLGDEEAFARRVRELLDDEALRLTMGGAARERVEARFALRRVIDQLLGVYSEVGN